MVKPFAFSHTPRILFGNGKIAELPAIARSYGNDILLVTGKNSFTNSKYGEYLLHTFEMAGISYHHVSIGWEPTPEMIDQTVILNKNNQINLVIAVGGGSALDAGKAISAMLNKTESILEYIEGVGTKEHPGTKVPFIAVPTTSGTGSEATKNAVISRIGQGGFKRSLRHDNLMPDYAIVDPELTLTCPPEVTAASGMDCFSQLMEAFLSEKSNPMTDALALDGLQYLKDSLIRAWKWGQDIEARTGMSYAALISGLCLANANLGAVHGFASSVGSLCNIPHGTVCGTLVAPTNKKTIEKLRNINNNATALNKYAVLGKLFIAAENKNNDWYINAFVDLLYEWTDLLKINRLGKYGITKSDLEPIASKTDSKQNPVKLDKSEFYQILEERL
jgi:alcohol dehydrogenase class IV